MKQTRLGNYQQARALLKGVSEPSVIEQRIAFHRLKAAVASGLGEFSAAAAEMQLALQLAPADANLILATAVAEMKANRFEAALQHARASGNNPVALALVGDIEEERGHIPAAIDAYRQAATLAPNEERYRLALASELIRHQAFATAIETLEQARGIFSSSANLIILLGIAHYAAGDTREAIELLTNATALKPASPASYLCLSQIALETSSAPPQNTLAALCQWDATVCAALEVRKARDTSDEALAQRAMQELQRAPASSSVAHCALGRAYEWREDLIRARRELETCVTQDPSPQNHYVLALLYKRLGQADLARRQILAREALLRKMSEETATGLKALESVDSYRPGNGRP